MGEIKVDEGSPVANPTAKALELADARGEMAHAVMGMGPLGGGGHRHPKKPYVKMYGMPTW